eukprot:12302428-Alexandrium_andersonii.AAC.1
MLEDYKRDPTWGFVVAKEIARSETLSRAQKAKVYKPLWWIQQKYPDWYVKKVEAVGAKNPETLRPRVMTHMNEM